MLTNEELEKNQGKKCKPRILLEQHLLADGGVSRQKLC